MKHWWNYIDTGKPKYAETNLSQCQFFPVQIPRGVAWDRTRRLFRKPCENQELRI